MYVVLLPVISLLYLKIKLNKIYETIDTEDIIRRINSLGDKVLCLFHVSIVFDSSLAFFQRNPWVLIGWRFLLGIGIGGDYATSSVIMAETGMKEHQQPVADKM